MATPYEGLKGLPAWKVLEAAIEDLVKNDDIEERTQRDYIVGYLVKVLSNSGFLTDDTKRGAE